MLFDLRGRRRRAVQATYLMLAVLKGGGGGSSGDSALEDRVDRQEERLAKSPQNEALLQNLIRDYYSLATGQRESGTVGFPADAKDELRKAGEYWQRYTKAVEGEPSADAARYALQVYDVGALNRPKEAQKAAAIIAKDSNDVASYLRLVSYAALAGDTRTADLAAKKAVDLA